MQRQAINYNNYRQQMRNGDVLLFRGVGLVSWLIQKRTSSPYSHAGIVAWWHDRLMVLEAVGDGVRAMPLSRNISTYSGGVDYYRSNRNIDDATRRQMVIFAQAQLGKAYAHRQLFRYAVMHVLGLPFSQHDRGAQGAAGKYFCSHYVAEIYRRHGYDLDIALSDLHTSPKVLVDSPYLDFIGTLK